MLRSYRKSTWDATIFQLCASGREYGTIDVRGKTVVDVGAHIGGFTEYALKNGAAKVISFEANPENFEHLTKNVGDNPRATLVQKAVWWNDTDKLGFRFSSQQVNTGGGNVTVPGGDYSIETISLESIMREYELESIDVLKLDCEGSEFPILYGAPAEVLQKVDMILGEYHNVQDTNSPIYTLFDFKGKRASFIDLQSYLASNGFDISNVKVATKQLGTFRAARK